MKSPRTSFKKCWKVFFSFAFYISQSVGFTWCRIFSLFFVALFKKAPSKSNENFTFCSKAKLYFALLYAFRVRLRSTPPHLSIKANCSLNATLLPRSLAVVFRTIKQSISINSISIRFICSQFSQLNTSKLKFRYIVWFMIKVCFLVTENVYI